MLSVKLVLDTNIIVSAHLNPDGFERSVLILALTDPARLFISPEILAEYEEVLRRGKLKIEPAHITESLQLITTKAMLVKPTLKLTITSDPHDNMFLECAQEAGADFLVTGNKRHFPRAWRSTKVVNARELIELVNPQLSEI